MSYLTLKLTNNTPDKEAEGPCLYYQAKGDFENTITLTLTNETEEDFTIPEGAVFTFSYKDTPLIKLGSPELMNAGDAAFAVENTAQDELQLRCTSEYEWKDDASLEFELKLSVVQQSNATGSVQLTQVKDFSELTDFFEGEEEPCESNLLNLALLETATDNQELQLDCDWVDDDNDVFVTPSGEEEIHNQIVFELNNHGDAVQGGEIKVMIAGPPNYDPDKDAPIRAWELASPDDLEDCRLILPEGIYKKDDLEAAAQGAFDHERGLMVWTIRPQQDGNLLGSGGANRLRVVIDHIASQHSKPGSVDLMVLLRGMDDYEDTVRFLTIDKKMPEPGIVRFDCKNLNNTVEPNEAVRLSWACRNVDDVWLSYTTKAGEDITIPTNGESLPLIQPLFELKRDEHTELPIGDDLHLFLYASKKAHNFKKEVGVEILDYLPKITITECKFIDDNKHLQLDYEFEHADEMTIASVLLDGGERVLKINKPNQHISLDTIEENISSWGYEEFTFTAKNTRGETKVSHSALIKPVINSIKTNYKPTNELEVTIETQYCNSGVYFRFEFAGNGYGIWNGFEWATKGGNPEGSPAEIHPQKFTYHVEDHSEFQKVWQAATEKNNNVKPDSLQLENCTLTAFNRPPKDNVPSVKGKESKMKELTIYATPELELFVPPQVGCSKFVQVTGSAFFNLAVEGQQILSLNIQTDTNEKTLFLKKNEKVLIPFDNKDHTDPPLKTKNGEYEITLLQRKETDSWAIDIRGKELTSTHLARGALYYSRIPDAYKNNADVEFEIVAKNHVPETTRKLYLQASIARSFGGDGGHPFAFQEPFSPRTIKIRADGDKVYAVRINDEWYGGKGGDISRPLTFTDEEYIKRIVVCTAMDGSHEIITYLKITSSKNDHSIEGGSKTFGKNRTLHIKDGRIFLMGGRSGNALDSLEVSYFEDKA